jgi:hypothetical protein
MWGMWYVSIPAMLPLMSGHETCLHHFTMKRKPKAMQSKGKMLMVFWVAEDILLLEFLDCKATLNAHCYCTRKPSM